MNLKDDTAGSGTKQYVIWPSVLQAIDLSNVTKIGTGVFWGQTNLKTVKFNDSLKEIGNRVFQSCASLSLKPETATNITKPADGTTVEIKTAGLPAGLESIGEYAFYRCENLDTVKFGSNITKIGKYAFSETIGHFNYAYKDSDGHYIAPTLEQSKKCMIVPI